MQINKNNMETLGCVEEYSIVVRLTLMVGVYSIINVVIYSAVIINVLYLSTIHMVKRTSAVFVDDKSHHTELYSCIHLHVVFVGYKIW
jgi:hypothetical protein